MAQQETSALFSLKELMRLEDDRVRQEQELRRRRAEEAEVARREAERAAREREEARLRFVEEQRLAAEVRRREEEARLDAIRAAEVERARIEAEERTRSAARAAERLHEQKLALLASDATKTRLRRGVWVGALACGALLVAAPVVYLAQIKPSADEGSRSLQAIIDAQREQRDQLQRELDLLNEKRHELEDRLQGVSTMPKVIEPPAPKPGPVRPAPSHKTPAVKAGPCTCDPHDPLCGCFAPK